MDVGISFWISVGMLWNCRLGMCLELRWECCGNLEGMSVGMSVGNQWGISMWNFNGEVQWGIEWRSSVGKFNEDFSTQMFCVGDALSRSSVMTRCCA